MVASWPRLLAFLSVASTVTSIHAQPQSYSYEDEDSSVAFNHLWTRAQGEWEISILSELVARAKEQNGQDQRSPSRDSSSLPAYSETDPRIPNNPPDLDPAEPPRRELKPAPTYCSQLEHDHHSDEYSGPCRGSSGSPKIHRIDTDMTNPPRSPDGYMSPSEARKESHPMGGVRSMSKPPARVDSPTRSPPNGRPRSQSEPPPQDREPPRGRSRTRGSSR